MKLDVTIEDRGPVRLGTVPHLGPYAGIGEAFERLHILVEAAGLPRSRMVELLGIYYDDPQTTPQAALRSDAAIAVPEDAVLPTGLIEKRLPAGRYARASHVGSYDGLPGLWQRLFSEWLPGSGQRLRARPAASFEIYRNTPEDVPPSALRTDLYVPIE
jgi:AraC family transcriptional regulator